MTIQTASTLCQLGTDSRSTQIEYHRTKTARQKDDKLGGKIRVKR